MGDLLLYDTLTRRKQPVYGSDGKSLRLYCCGPTVYGPAHIGNFRTFVAQDLFRRVAELSGLPTTHVRNITDVDDKTIRESQASGKTLIAFTAHWRKMFQADCAALNLLSPHIEPSAVDHIPDQIRLISTLMEKKHAYQGDDGSVYFKVSSFADYGKLTRIDQRELRTGGSERANDSDEYAKDNVADFALWKARKPEDGENYWQSPWGEGRPGWHLECSAMGLRYLGTDFDVHSGGVDLCFPHHENEIAQSTAATDEVFARLWFHAEHLMVEGQKMSKSLGNLHTLGDLAQRGFHPAEVRYLLLAGHYRQKLNFKFDELRTAQRNLKRIATVYRQLVARARTGYTYQKLVEAEEDPETLAGPFVAAWQSLQDDLNTAGALGHVYSHLKVLEAQLASNDIPPDAATDALRGLSLIVHAFGWMLPHEEPEAQAPPEVLELAKQRWEAKQARDWSAADSLRDQVHAAGWKVMDGQDGYKIVPIEK